MATYDDVRAAVERSEVDTALALLETLAAEKNHFAHEVSLHRAQWTRLTQQQRQSLVSPADANSAQQRLLAALLQCAQAIADHRTPSSPAPTGARARIAVVGVVAELRDALDAVVARLRQSPTNTVTLVDAVAPDAHEAARGHDLRVVLVGIRTGGTGALGALLDGGAVALKLAQVDPDQLDEDEWPAARRLRARIGDAFDTPDAAAHLAQQRFAAWLSTWTVVARGSTPALEPWEQAYLVARYTPWRAGAHEVLREATRGKSIDRARLYVSLCAEATPSLYVDGHGHLVVRDTSPDPRDVEAAMDGRLSETRANPWLEALVSHPALPHLVIDGNAGTGKTVLLQHVACALAAMHLGHSLPEHRLDRDALSAGAPLLRVPLLVEARRIATQLRDGTLGELLRALAHVVSEHTGETVTDDTVRDGLKAGRYVLLIDSLDEVPGVDARARLLDALSELASKPWPARLVLTTRPMSHTGLALPPQLRVARIAALDDDRVAALVARWAESIGEGDGYVRSAIEAIRGVRARHDRDPGDGLTGNALLLTCTLLVYDQPRRLPDSLAELYERMVQILCRLRATEGAPDRVKRELLERVCEAMQRAGSTALPVREAAEVVLRMRPEVGTITGATELLDRVAADTGLLRFENAPRNDGRVERVVRPWHRSFQEFLTACRLASGEGSVADETDALVVAPAGRVSVVCDATWEGTLGFLVGTYGERGSARAQGFVRRLLEHARGEGGVARAERTGRLLGLAARGVAEYRDLFGDGVLRDALRDAIATEFARTGATWPWRDRVLALEALGRIGDPRLDGDWWVEVPGGEFTFGDGVSHQSATPRRVRVETFRMSWCPVTVAAYAPFVADGGYANSTYWEDVPDDARIKEPRDWFPQGFHPNRPVVGVSWYEARAWCRWASTVRGETVELPTEVEWEYAARGPAGDVFPWGADDPGEGEKARANYAWGGEFVGSASPVGAFPGGYRGALADLAGNVWEWCIDPWSDEGMYVTTMTNPRAAWPLVVRGGSWDVHAKELRGATRVKLYPERWSTLIGFRVVCRGSRSHALPS